MEKEFVPYEQALALKELGFDEPCLGKFYYNQLEIGGNWCNNDFKEDPDVFISAPLYQQCFRWFREKYDLHSLIESFNQDENGNDIEYIYSYRIVTNKIFPKEMNVFFNSYEEAELECLKKLIEIVKNK
jgi:hypothetical protein